MVPTDRLLGPLVAALGETSEGVVIANPRLPDNPLIYANRGFGEMTGYLPEEAIGHNCRFLQCEETDQSQLDTLRTALAQGTRCTIEIVNARKDGTRFLNRLAIVPVTSPAGEVDYFVGIQSDVTELRRAQLEATEIKVLETTMRTVNDIALNAFSAMRYFALQISAAGTLSADDQHAMAEVIDGAVARLRAIAQLDHFETVRVGSTEIVKYNAEVAPNADS